MITSGGDDADREPGGDHDAAVPVEERRRADRALEDLEAQRRERGRRRSTAIAMVASRGWCGRSG